jgi:hypothetical protein
MINDRKIQVKIKYDIIRQISRHIRCTIYMIALTQDTILAVILSYKGMTRTSEFKTCFVLLVSQY